MCDKSDQPFVVAIEGNIGSGKSTMIKYLQQFQDVQVHPEPLEKWQNVEGENLLAKLYEDPARWCFQFQSYVQLTRLQIASQELAPGKRTKIVERSVQNNRFCFLELAKCNGNLSDQEFNVLDAWWQWLDTQMGLELDLIVYLRTTPEVAYDRMRKRARSEEAGAPLSYLQQLHNCYEDWLIKKKFEGSRLPPILVIDADQDLDRMKLVYSQVERKLRGLEPLEKQCETQQKEDDGKENIENIVKS